MIQLTAGLLLPLDGSETKFGVKFLQLLEECSPELFPRKSGNWEPLEFSCSGVNAEEIARKHWDDMFLWSCKRKGVDGVFSLASVYMHCGPVFFDKAGKSHDEITVLFEHLCSELPVDFGWVHVLGESEFKSVDVNNAERLWNPFNSGVTSNCLSNRGIPNLAWLTILGEPYLQYVKEEHFASCERVWRTTDDPSSPLFVQLTDSPFDPIDKYEEFDALRTEIKNGIPADIFCSREGNATVRPEFKRRDGSRLPF